jgi:hypothetical protein
MDHELGVLYAHALLEEAATPFALARAQFGDQQALQMFKTSFDRMQFVLKLADDSGSNQAAFSKAKCLFRGRRNTHVCRVLRWRGDESEPQSSESLLASIPAF